MDKPTGMSPFGIPSNVAPENLGGIRVALFAESVSPISKLIEWETRSKYCHAAIVCRDGSVVEAIEGVGVHRLTGLKTVKAPDHIDLFAVGSMCSADLVEAFLQAQIGKPYDWPDLFGFLTRDGKNEDRGAWFCSELAFAAIEAGGITLLRDIPPYQVSPATLSLSPFLIPVSS